MNHYIVNIETPIDGGTATLEFFDIDLLVNAVTSLLHGGAILHIKYDVVPKPKRI